MSADWDRSALLEPIAPDRPCGDDLEDTHTLAAVEAHRVFGLARSIDVADERSGGRPGEKYQKPPDPPKWSEVKEAALAALGTSKDLRALTHLGAALLRTGDVLGFLATVDVASQWLDTYWDDAYPRVDADEEDDEGRILRRRSALNCFADPVVVLEGLSRVTLVDDRQHGRFSFRDVEIANGQITPGKTERRPAAAAIDAAFGAMPIEGLTGLHGGVKTALGGLARIDARMREQAGATGAPAFGPLVGRLRKIERLLGGYVTARAPAVSGEVGAGGEEGGAMGEGTPGGAAGDTASPAAIGAIRTRQDALRALDAVTAFFRQQEPSSPVPLFIERAKRLVSKDFLEVLADVAPEAIAQAKAAGGLKDKG